MTHLDNVNPVNNIMVPYAGIRLPQYHGGTSTILNSVLLVLVLSVGVVEPGPSNQDQYYLPVRLGRADFFAVRWYICFE